ncbi:MAG TPA: hypothetical protein VFE47_01570 [Tepidisphaeraceae bacterium]|jgi:hypothetical protein|nr:hypothetical protein [Tepidisphaeraceae bacterium]
MKQHRLVMACSAVLTLPLAWAAFSTTAALAQQAPAVPPPLVQPPADAPLVPSASAEGTITEVAPTDELPLGRPYESLSVGLSFRPPASCKLSSDMGTSTYIAEWADTDRDWTLKLGRMIVDHSAPLVTTKDKFDDKEIEGILDKTVKNLKASLPGSQLLRNDVTNTRGNVRRDSGKSIAQDNVGLIAIRYSFEGHHKLSQEAIIQSSDGVYYLLTLTSPGDKAALDNPTPNAPADPNEVLAVNTFNQMIDSIKLIDRKAIYEDQVERLSHSRLVVVNWTPEKLHRVILNEQWMRIMKDGKDVGYSYITEDQAGGIPRPLKRQELINAEKSHDNGAEQRLAPHGDGILIGVRASTTMTGIRSDKTKGPIQIDSSFWGYTSADRKHEDFSRVVVTDDHIAPKKGYVQEFGMSDKRDRRVYERPQQDPNADANAISVPADRNNGILVFKEDWELNVNLASNSGNAAPVIRKLPPWYVSQALAHLLPRLLPLDRPQKYLFAVYVSDSQQVVMRYMDVLPEQIVVFNGQQMRAIPIKDRLGLEGAVTMHYMSIEGNYLGSENREQKLVLIPTNDATIRQIWSQANLTRPDGVERGAPADARR